MTKQHTTTADIQAIIKSRTEQAVKLREASEGKPSLSRAMPPMITVQSIPAAPPAKAEVPPTEMPDLDQIVTTFLAEYLPNLISKTQPAALAIKDLFTPPFSMGELWTAAARARELGDTISVSVSEAVAVGAPAIKGLDALALVQVIVRFLLRRFVQSTVPTWIYPMIETAIVAAVGLIYETQIRPKLKGPRK